MPRADREARELLAEHGITDPPVPVADIADALGVQIVFEDFGETDISAMLMRDETGAHPVIGVNKRQSTNRRNFSIAHELGHFVLHKGKPLIVDRARVNFRDTVSSMGTDYDEMQANAFAAELLMPRSFVLAAVREFTDETEDFTSEELIDVLANRFAVSSAAMGYRLMNLGITSPQ